MSWRAVRVFFVVTWSARWHDVAERIRPTFRDWDDVLNYQRVWWLRFLTAVRAAPSVKSFQCFELRASEIIGESAGNARATSFASNGVLIRIGRIPFLQFLNRRGLCFRRPTFVVPSQIPLRHLFLVRCFVALLAGICPRIVAIFAAGIQPIGPTIRPVELVGWFRRVARRAAFLGRHDDGGGAPSARTSQTPRCESRGFVRISTERCGRLRQLALTTSRLSDFEACWTVGRTARLTRLHEPTLFLEVEPVHRDHSSTSGARLRQPVNVRGLALRGHTRLAVTPRSPLRVPQVPIEVGRHLQQPTSPTPIHLLIIAGCIERRG